MTTFETGAETFAAARPLAARRTRRPREPKLTTRAVILLASCTLAFLYLPLVVLVLFSFNSNDITVLPLTGWTLDWYHRAFQNAFMLDALKNSFVVAGAAIVISQIIGIPTGFALMRWNFPGNVVLKRIVIMPISLPALILGIALLNYFTMMGVKLSIVTIMIGHGTIMSSIVVTNLFARLLYFDQRIEEASADLGAKPWQTFWFVTLPNIKSTLIGSAMITFTVSFDELALTYFVNGNTNTLPMYIWSMLRQGMTPEINAIGSCVIAGSIILVGFAIYFLSDKAPARVRPR